MICLGVTFSCSALTVIATPCSSEPQRNRTSRPFSRWYRAYMSAGRYAPARCPRCTYPFAYGNAAVINMRCEVRVMWTEGKKRPGDEAVARAWSGSGEYRHSCVDRQLRRRLLRLLPAGGRLDISARSSVVFRQLRDVHVPDPSGAASHRATRFGGATATPPTVVDRTMTQASRSPPQAAALCRQRRAVRNGRSLCVLRQDRRRSTHEPGDSFRPRVGQHLLRHAFRRRRVRPKRRKSRSPATANIRAVGISIGALPAIVPDMQSSARALRSPAVLRESSEGNSLIPGSSHQHAGSRTLCTVLRRDSSTILV